MKKFNIITKILKENIDKISKILGRLPQNKKNELEKIISKYFYLFSLKQEETYKEKKIQTVINLASFFIINKILFYYLYFKIKKSDITLEPIQKIEDLKLKFNEIQEEEFELFFSINILHLISDDKSALSLINNFIKDLNKLKPELIKHNLVGRLFQESLPFISRKKSAAYYTRPIAAELLANLVINSTEDVIVDFACGSGTLLISAFKRKLDLVQYMEPENALSNSILNDIIGLDLMPFATYLTMVNLLLFKKTSQIECVKIALANALAINKKTKLTSIKAKFTKKELKEFDRFDLSNVNIVLINPPFTRKEILSNNLKHELLEKWSEFKSMSYWGYFLLLADSILEENGKIAAVIPSGFFRGRDTLDLRKFLFENKKYKFKYIIKSTKNAAFTEFALQRDFLLILEKKRSVDSSYFGLVYLLKDIDKYSLEDIKNLGKTIKSIQEGKDFKSNQLEIKWIEHSKILKGINNLWHIVGFSSPDIQEILNSFHDNILQSGVKLNKLVEMKDIIPSGNILRGLEPKPRGLFKSIFLVRSFMDQRTSRSNLIIQSETVNNVIVKSKNSGKIFKIPKIFVKQALKTHVYYNKLSIDEPDYIIFSEFGEFKSILQDSKVSEIDFSYVKDKGKNRLAHLFIIRRFGFSKGTRLFCFFSEEKLIPSKNFYIIKTDLETAKILTLWFNGSFSIIEFLLTRRETSGSWGELVKDDMNSFMIPSLNAVEKARLLKIFENIKNLEFPTISKQFETCFKGRKIIDEAFLNILGFESDQIENILNVVYPKVAEELKNLNQIKK
ncbi:MAG: N-6 DNA methylase [Candidatus Helarchaeota archaeon]